MAQEDSKRIKYERREHLMRLGFTLDEVLEGRLYADDDLWELAKDLPTDPNSEYAQWGERFCEALKEELTRMRAEGRPLPSEDPGSYYYKWMQEFNKILEEERRKKAEAGGQP